MAPKKGKKREIAVVHNFGGRRATGVPVSCRDWGLWDCDPTVEDREPTQGHGYGKEFPWVFDMEEKAYGNVDPASPSTISFLTPFLVEVLEGEATLTADDPDLHGDPVRIVAKDMVAMSPGRAVGAHGD